MDRLRRFLSGGTLAVVLGTIAAASGCRSTRDQVPPGPKYSTTGDPSGSGFNSSPHPYNAMTSPYANNPATGSAMPGGMGGPSGLGGGTTPGSPTDGLPPVSPGAGSSFGTPAPGTPGMGMPTSNSYGPPGTSGLGR